MKDLIVKNSYGNIENDFSILNEENGEINFVNNKLKNKIIEDKLNNKTLGL